MCSGVPKRDEKDDGQENIFEEIMAKNVSNLIEDIKLQIQKTLTILIRIKKNPTYHSLGLS